MQRLSGPSPSCKHLAARNLQNDSSSRVSQASVIIDQDYILDKILEMLDVSKANFSPNLPFTSFGLDSLGATRISLFLRPYVNVSQMQLLGGVSWEQIQHRLEESLEQVGQL